MDKMDKINRIRELVDFMKHDEFSEDELDFMYKAVCELKDLWFNGCCSMVKRMQKNGEA